MIYWTWLTESSFKYLMNGNLLRRQLRQKKWRQARIESIPVTGPRCIPATPPVTSLHHDWE